MSYLQQADPVPGLSPGCTMCNSINGSHPIPRVSMPPHVAPRSPSGVTGSFSRHPTSSDRIRRGHPLQASASRRIPRDPWSGQLREWITRGGVANGDCRYKARFSAAQRGIASSDSRHGAKRG